MKWYGASLLMRSFVDGQPDGDNDLYEEQIVLIRAADAIAARARAERRGLDAEESFENAVGGRVKWKFQRVLAVFEMFDDEPRDGTEVFSRFLDRDEVDALIRSEREGPSERAEV